MSAVSVLDKDTIYLIARECPQAMAYANHLASNADADGNGIDSRARSAALLGRHARTITRYRNALESAGVILRVAGGHKGECIRYTIKRYARDTTVYVAKRARAALWLARASRRAALATAARKRGLSKGDTAGTRFIIQMNDLGVSRRLDPHDFRETETVGWCECGLPRPNAIHRG